MATNYKQRKVPERKADPIGDLVIVPREVFTEDLWSRPFSELCEMAARGEHGMSMSATCKVSNAAALRGGRDFGPNGQNDRAFLYAQNW